MKLEVQAFWFENRCVKQAVFDLCKLEAYMLVLANTRRRKDFKTIIYLASIVFVFSIRNLKMDFSTKLALNFLT